MIDVVGWDGALMAATMGLNVFLLPTLLNPSARVPRMTSAPFSICIAVLALALFQLANPLGAAANAAGSVMWAFVFVKRGGRNAVHRS